MKKAFTLAEVLLTLAIIGVVAALTIPAVITKVQQDQYVVGLKKAFNTLKAVNREAIREYGEMKNWTFTGTETDFNKYYKPYFDVLKDCGATSDNNCFVSMHHNMKGNDFANLNMDPYYKIVTSDGIAFAYYSDGQPYPGRTGYFWVDVNGKKGPNRSGRDLFHFNVFPDLGVQPAGNYYHATAEKMTSEYMESNCTSPSSGNNATCSLKVLSEGAMNY